MRQWTLEKLNEGHPLPDGWAWRLWDGEPMACSGDLEIFADGDEVWGQGRESNMTALPSKVCLAVILASQGLDSREAMAADLDERVAKALPRAEDSPYHEGLLTGYACAAMMLRRGTVAP
jgi:hypothetical protein